VLFSSVLLGSSPPSFPALDIEFLHRRAQMRFRFAIVVLTALTVGVGVGPPHPFERATAGKVERLAWLAYDQGKRNVYTAVAPAFQPVRLTSFMKDDGTDLTDIAISDDGSTVAFVRGHTPNRDGWIANPSSDPAGFGRGVWAPRTAAPPGRACGDIPRLATAGSPIRRAIRRDPSARSGPRARQRPASPGEWPKARAPSSHRTDGRCSS